MKQLTTVAEIIGALNLEADIFVKSARQNGSTRFGDVLTSLIVREAKRLVRTEDLVTGDVELTKDITVSSEQPTVNIYVKSSEESVDLADNHIHCWLGESVLTTLIVSGGELYYAFWEGVREEGNPYLTFDLPMAEATQQGVSPAFLEFHKSRVGYDLTRHIMAVLDSRKPITVLGRKPRQGASTFAGCLASALAARNGLSLSLFSQLNEPAVLRGIRFEGIEWLDSLEIRHDPCHFAAGMETVQRVEYEMSSRIEKAELTVVLVDELVPQFEVPGIARANAVSADIFVSSAQIRFANKVRELLEEKSQQLGFYGIITGSDVGAGELTVSPNTIVTYLNGELMSVLAIGETAYAVAHLRIKEDKESGLLYLSNCYGESVPDLSEVAENFSPDVDNVIRYFKDLSESKEFERESAEISAEAERAASKPVRGDGLR